MNVKIRAFFITHVIVCCLAFSLRAQDKFQADERISVDIPVRHDLYLAAKNIIVKAPVYGDLRAAAGEVEILDTINGDLSIAGGTVSIMGPVQDDLIVFGGDININNNVTGDLIVMGGSVNIGREVIIAQDLVVFAGEVSVEGTVMGAVTLWGGEVRHLGESNGALSAKGGEVLLAGTMRGPVEAAAEVIVLEPGTRIYGELRYWMPEEKFAPDFDKAMINNTASYDSGLALDQEDTWLGFTVPWVILVIAYFLSVLLMLAFLIWLFDKPFIRTSEKLRENFMASFGYGILYFLGMPLVIGLLLFTIVGIPLGLFFLFAYGFSLLFGHLIAAVILTCTIKEQYQYHWNKGTMILVAFLVFATIRGLTLTPILGLFLSVLLVGACFGAIIMTAMKKQRAVPA